MKQVDPHQRQMLIYYVPFVSYISSDLYCFKGYYRSSLPCYVLPVSARKGGGHCHEFYSVTESVNQYNCNDVTQEDRDEKAGEGDERKRDKSVDWLPGHL